MKFVYFSVAMLLICSALPAQQPAPAPSWEAWQFLVGKWVGEGATGDVGRGTGISRSRRV